MLEASTINPLGIQPPVTGVQEYPFQEGITEEQILQLIDYSCNDPLIQRFTSDGRRFGSREAFDRWLMKGRTVYTLRTTDLALAGIVWFGQEPLPTREYLMQIDPSCYGITLAMRLYAEARGKGIAEAVVHTGMTLYMNSEAYSYINNNSFWFETSADNNPVRKIFTRMGFFQITNPDQSEKILMTGNEGAIRSKLVTNSYLPTPTHQVGIRN